MTELYSTKQANDDCVRAACCEIKERPEDSDDDHFKSNLEGQYWCCPVVTSFALSCFHRDRGDGWTPRAAASFNATKIELPRVSQYSAFSGLSTQGGIRCHHLGVDRYRCGMPVTDAIDWPWREHRAIVPSRGLNGGDSRKTQAFAVGGKTPWPIDQPAPSREADAGVA